MLYKHISVTNYFYESIVKLLIAQSRLAKILTCSLEIMLVYQNTVRAHEVKPYLISSAFVWIDRNFKVETNTFVGDY